ITSTNATTFTVGGAGSCPVTATGTPAPSLALGDGAALAVGVTFNAVAGTLEGTPSAHSGSTYTFDIVAHNGIGIDFIQHFTLTVNEAPAITSDSSTSFVVGSPGIFNVTAGGFPTPLLTEDGGDTLPGGITFDAATGALSGTPTAGSGGVYSLHFTASNGVLPDYPQTFTLTIDEGAAFTSPGSATFTTGAVGTTTIAASGEPTPSITEDPTDTLPSGVTFDPVTDVLSGTPAAGSGRTYTLHFAASN